MDQLVSVVDIGALTAFTLLHASVVGWFAVGRRGRPVLWWATRAGTGGGQRRSPSP